MNAIEYDKAVINLTQKKEALADSYIGKWIPRDIELTMIELVLYITVAKDLLFFNDKLLPLSIFNIIKWWRFLKITYAFIKKIIEIWK